MNIKFHNTDRLDPDLLFRTPGVSHVFADTQMEIRHLHIRPYGVSRVFVRPIDRAMVEGATAHGFVFDFAETPHDRKEYEFARIFGRFPRVWECFQSFSQVKWPIGAKSPDQDDALLTIEGHVLIIRQLHPCDYLYSPFKRLPWLECKPKRWDTKTLVRALQNGQFSAVRRRILVPTADGVAESKTENYEGICLARKLVEDSWMNWRISGDNVVIVSGQPKEMQLSEEYEVLPVFY